MNNINPSCKIDRQFVLPGKIVLKMIWCPPGEFLMGSPLTESERCQDEPLHPVILTHGFWIGQHVVTQEQYKAVTGNMPSGFCGKYLPVDSVSHSDALEFCHSLKIHIINKQEVSENSHFSLPTEAQWEYACRAGTRTSFHYGAGLDSNLANFDGQHPYNANKGVYRRKSCDVGCFLPNSWGIYDMHGNISEWCLDGYRQYDIEATKDPIGIDNGDGMVCRGGSWGSRATDCRSAKRKRLMSAYKNYYLGFRIVLNIP